MARHSASAKDGRLLSVIHLKDIIKGGIPERFSELRRMGIRTVMITGDNPLTAAAIAAESGVDDFLAQATPETKLKLIRDEQAQGKLVAMCGDGTNDAPALAQADVGVAMNTGTMAAREAGNMVDLDSDTTKLIEIVEIGKQLLMTRGALTTFSIANDVAKYFAMIPAMFIAFYPQLQALNVMRLGNPESAILSAIIFNALIIVALIPLALRGVAYRPIGARATATDQTPPTADSDVMPQRGSAKKALSMRGSVAALPTFAPTGRAAQARCGQWSIRDRSPVLNITTTPRVRHMPQRMSSARSSGVSVGRRDEITDHRAPMRWWLDQSKVRDLIVGVVARETNRHRPSCMQSYGHVNQRCPFPITASADDQRRAAHGFDDRQSSVPAIAACTVARSDTRPPSSPCRDRRPHPNGRRQ